MWPNKLSTDIGKIRLWLGNGDCVRHRSEYKDHVWSYDFVHERTKDKRSFRILTIIDELLNGEIFYTLKEAKIMIERWRVHYNTKRPHTSLGYRPPAPETMQIPNTIIDYEN